MQITTLILLSGIALFSGGCSALIANTGTDISQLSTREHVHLALGEPSSTHQSDVTEIEEYCTRRKIADHHKGTAYAMMFGMLFGVAEPIFTLKEIGLLTQHAVIGRDLKFKYGDDGAVISYEFEDSFLGSKIDVH